MTKFMELGNIRFVDVFRACGFNSELYHLEILEDAAADRESLEGCWTPPLPTEYGHFSRAPDSPRERGKNT